MFTKINSFLVRKFIPNWQDTQDASVRASYGYLEGYISVLGNFLLFVLKLIGGLWINSISLLADAFHTLSDVLTSVAVIVGFKVSKKPGDKEHPFGHGRAEYIATFIVSTLLIIVGIEFLKGSIDKLLHPEPTHYNHIVFGIMLFSTLAKEWLYNLAKYLGLKIDSKALIADAWHHRSDAIASLLIGIALYGTKLGFNNLDAILGVVVSFMIMYTGYELIKDCANDIIGTAPSPELIEQIKQEVLSISGTENVHQIEVHKYGQKQYAYMHIEVDPTLNTLQSHEIADTVMNNLNEKLGIAALVHIDPVQKKPAPHKPLVTDQSFS